MWTKFAYQTGAWMALEIWLNLIGLDNITDYSKFIFALEGNLNLKNPTTIKISESPPQFCPKIENFCPLPGWVRSPSDLLEYGCQDQGEIIPQQCLQLAQPCLKVVCLAKNVKSDRYPSNNVSSEPTSC